jgi:hypothetical protein
MSRFGMVSDMAGVMIVNHRVVGQGEPPSLRQTPRKFGRPTRHFFVDLPLATHNKFFVT